jgi:hypothetical protein
MKSENEAKPNDGGAVCLSAAMVSFGPTISARRGGGSQHSRFVQPSSLSSSTCDELIDPSSYVIPERIAHYRIRYLVLWSRAFVFSAIFASTHPQTPCKHPPSLKPVERSFNLHPLRNCELCRHLHGARDMSSAVGLVGS